MSILAGQVAVRVAEEFVDVMVDQYRTSFSRVSERMADGLLSKHREIIRQAVYEACLEVERLQ